MSRHCTAVIPRSQQMGRDREILRLHFPTDFYTGRTLAHALLANREVRSQLDALRPELQQALSRAPTSK